jgi:glycosyltransferase involved in cell wall biosynthesis
MKIAVWHNLPSGGGKRALWDHVSGLISRGHEVESWCPSTANQDFLPLKRICVEHVLSFKRKGRWKASLGLWHLLREMDDHCRECARQMRDRKFDILLANSCFLFATSPIGKHVQIPSALYLGEPHRQFYEALPELLWLTMTQSGKGLRRFRLARSLANMIRLHAMRTQARFEISNAAAFDKILVNSLFSRESVLRAYGLPAQVCYLGVNTEHFQPSIEPAADYIIGLGAIGYHKGLDRAIKAVGAVPDSIRPRLIWVGNQCYEGDYMNKIMSLAKSMGVQFEIKMMISDDELVSLLGHARVMLYTSRLEPFGFAPLEANACGVPVVAIAEGGVRETIEHGHNGLLVPDEDPGKLASALTTLLTESSFNGEMRSMARGLMVTRWSLDAAASRLEKALLETIEGKEMSSK